MAIKVDMVKAYDRVEWGPLKTILKLLGFDGVFVNWIYEVISTISFSFLLHDSYFCLF